VARRGRLTEAGRAAAELPLGSWRRTLIVALVVVGVFGAVVGVATRLGDLRHSSFPGHPYPPPGTYRNPFSNNPDDLVTASQAARVRAEFQRDSQIDLQAVERGDVALLPQARTGNALNSLHQLIESNNAQGVAEHEQVKDDALVVGRLPDPNDGGVTWCVEERGTATITYFTKGTGRTIRTQTVHFDYRTWLSPVGNRYLITDVGSAAATR
jgi:hypothetical protein